MGQELTLTAYGRGDVYHTDDAADTSVDIYRGTDGWHARAIGALAADVKWPFVGPLFGGIQRLVPRVQLVLTPPTPNLDIPNEDARAIDLEDSNLFALNRFPGYDRWEDGSRITYGARLVARPAEPVDHQQHRPELSNRPPAGDLPGGHGPDRPAVGHRRPDPHPLRPVHRPHPPLPPRQGQSRRSAETSST